MSELIQLQRDTVHAINNLVSVQQERLAIEKERLKLKQESLLLKRLAMGIQSSDIMLCNIED